MPINTELVKRNFEVLAEQELKLTHKVYETLFSAHPELLHLFTSRHSAAGAQMVRETLMYAIDHVNNETWITMNIGVLGTQHRAYEVSEEMYGWFVDAMLSAMAEVSAEHWTAEVETSWRELFWYLADIMIAKLPARSRHRTDRQGEPLPTP